jgi:hypothetical protein
MLPAALREIEHCRFAIDRASVESKIIVVTNNSKDKTPSQHSARIPSTPI